MTGFFTAPRIAWGTGAIEQLSALGARRVLVVADPEVAGRGGEQRVLEELAKSDASIELVTDLAQPDHLATVLAVKDRLIRSAPERLIVIGGGRTIDGAKAARLAAERPDLAVEQMTPLTEVPDPPKTRLAAIPTTSGSGSEASWTADLVATDGAPFELAHRALVPEWALVDPAFAATLPPEEVVDGGFESAAIAIEAFLSAWSNPFSDALAVDAAVTVLRRLPHAVRWSDDPEARGALHYAATLAGLAASNAQRGVAHALARALTAPAGLPYGRLLGLVLPAVLEFDHPAARERLEQLAVAATPPDELGRNPLPLPVRLRRIADVTRLPAGLAAAGAPLERVAAATETIVAETLRSPAVLANPRVPTANDLRGLLRTLGVGAAAASGSSDANRERQGG